MTPATRNPKTEPTTGDRIRKGSADGIIRRIVTGRHNTTVMYKGSDSGMTKTCTLPAWRNWAQDAIVE